LRKRMGKVGRQHAETNFSYGVIAQQLLNRYKQIVNRTEKASARLVEHN